MGKLHDIEGFKVNFISNLELYLCAIDNVLVKRENY